MPHRLDAADGAPPDGALPQAALAQLATAPLGVYVHVPFCATRCGYCDFNTYTATELGSGGGRADYPAAVERELALAARILGDDRPPAATVFFGGGTPTLLGPDALREMLRSVERHLGLAPGAEVTTEANPDSVDPAALTALREAGFTRVSLGMQSAAPHVLGVLERTHTPGRAVAAAKEASAAGFDHVSLDLIYGTPGETAEDWDATLQHALEAEPDHVSAYGLTVEPGTRLAAQVRRGVVPAPDDDAMADRYLAADERLGRAGLDWYELSNWAADDDARCRHNLGYWRAGNWWGAGPGAHAQVGGVRWWNVLHPSAYAAALTEHRSPAAGRELLDAPTRAFERVMLGVRLREGLPLAQLDAAAVEHLVGQGLLAIEDGRAALTLEGRLKADLVTRELTP